MLATIAATAVVVAVVIGTVLCADREVIRSRSYRRVRLRRLRARYTGCVCCGAGIPASWVEAVWETVLPEGGRILHDPRPREPLCGRHLRRWQRIVMLERRLLDQGE